MALETAVALDDDRTAGALDRYRRRSWRWLGGGVALVAVVAGLAARLVDVGPERTTVVWLVAVAALTAGVVAVGLGTTGLARVAKMRRVLERHPWQRWACRCNQQHFGSYDRHSLRLSPDDGSDDPAVLALLPALLPTTLSRSGLACAPAVEVAGHPATGRAVVRAGGQDVLIPVRGRALVESAERVPATI